MIHRFGGKRTGNSRIKDATSLIYKRLDFDTVEEAMKLYGFVESLNIECVYILNLQLITR